MQSRSRAVSMEHLEWRRMMATWQPLHEPGNGGWSTSLAVSPHSANHLVMGGDILGVGVSFDRGASWNTPTRGLRNWEMGSSTFHPSSSRGREVWIGSLNGPYRSMDGGRTWNQRRRGMPAQSDGDYSQPIEKVLFDRDNPRRMFAFAGNHRQLDGLVNARNLGKIYRSLDGGNKWTLLYDLDPDPTDNDTFEYPGGRYNIMSATYSADGNTIFVAVDGKGLFRFSDNRSNEPVRLGNGLPEDADVQFVVTHPTLAGVLWVALGSGEGVYKSTDFGETFAASNGTGETALPTLVNGEDPLGSFKAMAVHPGNGDVLYVGNEIFENGAAGVWRSGDGGASWQAVMTDESGNWPASQPAGPSVTWLEVDRDGRVYAINSDNLFTSGDDGANWTDLMNTTPAGSVEGGLRGRGFAGWVAQGFSFNPYVAGVSSFQASDAGKQWTSLNHGHTWSYQAGLGSFSGGRAVSYSRPDESGGYVAVGVFGQQFEGDFAVARSVDGGLSWTRFDNFPYSYLTATEIEAGEDTRPPTDVWVDPNDARRIWVVSAGMLYHTSDGGTSWTEIGGSIDPALGNLVAHPELSSRIENGVAVYRHVYVSGRNGIYRLGSDGLSLAKMDGSPVQSGPNESGVFTSIAIDPTDPDRIYVANWRSQANGGLHRYSPAAGWTRINGDAQIAAAAVDPLDANRVFATTNDNPFHDESFASGVLVTTNALARSPAWSSMSAGLPHLAGSVLEFDPYVPHRLVLGTSGRGYHVTDVGRSRPFASTAPSVRLARPSLIEAERYDRGGAGVAFSDSTPVNSGGGFRNDAVDIRSVAGKRGAFRLTATAGNEWLAYTVRVVDAGTYTLRLRVAAESSGARLHLQANGLNVTGSVVVPATGSLDQFSKVTVPGVRLTSGAQRLTLFVERGGVEVDWFSLGAEPVGASASAAMPVRSSIPSLWPFSKTGITPATRLSGLRDESTARDFLDSQSA
jgi:hypothetical protein